MPERERTPNHHLAALMREAGMSNKGLAKRMRDLSRSDGGMPVSPTHTNIDKWVSGRIVQPNARNCHVMLAVFSHELGWPLTLQNIGYGDVPPAGVDTTLEYPDTIADSITSLTQLTSYELGTSEPTTRLHVVPEAWSSLLVKATYGSHAEDPAPAEQQPITEAEVEQIHDATQMFATFDYRHGGGRPKPLVAKYLDSAVLPNIPHASPNNFVGRE